jgi:oxygen-dependent protoporphyrinogen oxidase
MVRLTVPAADWPDRLLGRSGYLVPKPDQRYVTAASFGSQKWNHWKSDDGSQLLRVSLGRDGLAIAHLSDDDAISATIDEVSRHLDIDLQPGEVDVARWVDAFPQYRPHHHQRVEALETALPAGLVVAGASYHGIGIPACIADGRRAARRVVVP